MLEKYDRVLPGLADRIVAMAERQSKHRQELETAAVGGNISAQRRGQFLAFWIVALGMGVGTYLIATGKSTAGLTALLTPLGIVAAAFFLARGKQTKELDRKRATLDQAASRGQ